MSTRIPSVEIRFGGQTRRLIFDYNALAELQDLRGTYRSERAGIKSLRDHLYCGLLAETLDEDLRRTERTLTLRQVGEILLDMDKADVDALGDAVQRAQSVSRPDPPSAPAPPTAQA